ncbi:MAG: hypothetical protein AB7H88_20590 [Vicinamibacterales bacterium]
MPNQLEWHLVAGERNPFEPEGRRLRITVHCPEEDRLNETDRRNLALLRELANVDKIRIVETKPGARWSLALNTTPNEHGVGVAAFVGPDGSVRCWHAFRPRDWEDEAIRFRRIGSKSDPEIVALGRHLMFVEAHEQCMRDVFATTLPELLSRREHRQRANIRSLSETLEILGLWLRRDGEIPIKARPHNHSTVQHNLGLDLFRWVATRDRLPGMWRYFSACIRRGSEAKDKMEYLGNTILDRCERVMQAVDEVGWQFHRRQSNTTRQTMLYHFDYLALLLSGALDAEAQVCRTAYGLTVPPSRTHFRYEPFRKQLRAAGGTRLADLLVSDGYRDFQQFLGALRNSIHGTGIRGMGYVKGGEPERSLVQIFDNDQVIWEASGKLGRDIVGVAGVAGGVAIEPYTCASWLARSGFYWVNRIGELTEVERLVSGDTKLMNGPPNGRFWDPDTRRRVSALTWGVSGTSSEC